MRRKADDVMIAWISLLRPTIKYEVRQVAGPGLPGVLLIEGSEFSYRRMYLPPSAQQVEDVFNKGMPAPRQQAPAMFDGPATDASLPPAGSICVGAIGDAGALCF